MLLRCRATVFSLRYSFPRSPCWSARMRPAAGLRPPAGSAGVAGLPAQERRAPRRSVWHRVRRKGFGPPGIPPRPTYRPRAEVCAGDQHTALRQLEGDVEIPPDRARTAGFAERADHVALLEQDSCVGVGAEATSIGIRLSAAAEKLVRCGSRWCPTRPAASSMVTTAGSICSRVPGSAPSTVPRIRASADLAIARGKGRRARPGCGSKPDSPARR